MSKKIIDLVALKKFKSKYDEDLGRKIDSLSSKIGDDLTYTIPPEGVTPASSLTLFITTEGIRPFDYSFTAETFEISNSHKYLVIMQDSQSCSSRMGGIWQNSSTPSTGRITLSSSPFPNSHLYYGLNTNSPTSNDGVAFFQWFDIVGNFQIGQKYGVLIADVTELLENNPNLVGSTNEQTAYNIINFFGVDKINELIETGEDIEKIGNIQVESKNVIIGENATLGDMLSNANSDFVIKSVIGAKSSYSFTGGDVNLNLWESSTNGEYSTNNDGITRERFGGKVYLAISYDNLSCDTRYVGLWQSGGSVGDTNRKTLSSITGHTNWYGAIIIPNDYNSSSIFVAQYLTISSASGNVLTSIIDITNIYDQYVGATQSATIKNVLDGLTEDVVLSIMQNGEYRIKKPLLLDINALGNKGNLFKNQVGRQWNGKKWYAFGTSITDTSYFDSSAGDYTGKYVPYVMNNFDMKLYNKGIAGGTIATGGIFDASGSILTEILATDLSDADIVTIEGFVNDYACGVPLGDETSSTKYSLFGALKIAVEYIQTHSSAIVVLLTESTGREYNDVDYDYDYQHLAYKSEDDHTQIYLTQNDYNEVIRKVAKFCGCYCIDAGSKSQINKNHPSYLIDHIHQSQLGAKQYAKVICDELSYIRPEQE